VKEPEKIAYGLVFDVVELQANAFPFDRIVDAIADAISTERDQQAARIAELEALLKKSDEGWEAEAGKRLEAEARADAAWCAGRDAAAELAQTRDNGWDDDADLMARGIANDIRALTPPEDKP
jgi:hypothetical protein